MLTIILLFTVAVTLILLFKARPEGDLKPISVSPILDMHVHVAGIGANSDCSISSEMFNNWRYTIYLKAFGTDETDLRTNGDTIIFDRIAARLSDSKLVDGAVLLALDRPYDPDTGQPDEKLTEVYIPNDFVRDGCRRFTQLHYGASVNPDRPDWEKELVRVKKEGAVLIKWLPAIQHIDPSATRHEAFYRKLTKLKLPLLCHTGAEDSFSSSNDALGDPQLLRLALDTGVTVIAAHVATTGSIHGEAYIDRLLPMLQEYDNLYTDISSLTQLNKVHYPGRIIDIGAIRHKLIYGSDFPLISAGVGPFRLVSPWNFFWKVSWTQLARLSKISNDWDRDLLLKQALGFSVDCFTRSAKLLKITPKADT
jgi:hypothetical protein